MKKLFVIGIFLLIFIVALFNVVGVYYDNKEVEESDLRAEEFDITKQIGYKEEQERLASEGEFDITKQIGYKEEKARLDEVCN